MKYFAKNVRYLREKSGKLQSEISNSAGFSRTAWNNYESGLSQPNIEGLVRIAKLFGVSESKLLHVDLSKGPLPDKTQTMGSKSLQIEDLKSTLEKMEKAFELSERMRIDLSEQISVLKDQLSELRSNEIPGRKRTEK